jgi:hypothetical protein
MLRALLATIVTFVFTLVTHPAMAQGNAVLVARFQGSKPQGLRDLTVQLLEADGFTVAPGGESLSGDSGEYSVVSAARKTHAVAVVLVTTGLTKTSWRSTITVRDGASGKSVGEATITGKSYKGLQKAYKQNLVTELMPLFEKCSAEESSSKPAASTSDDSFDSKPAAEEDPNELPPEDEPTSEAEGEASADLDLGPDETQQRRDSLKKTEALSLTLGPNLTLRSWSINDPLTNAGDGPLLPAHDVPAMGFRAGLLVFPAAFFTDSVARHIGVQVNYAMSLFGQTNVENVTRDPNDKVRDTTLQSFDAGLHVRIPLEPLTLGIIGGYGFDAIVIDGTKTSVAVPDVQADFIRAGVLAQLALGKATFARLGLGYRHLLGFGEEAAQLQSANWFPKSLGTAFDARLEFRQMFSPSFGLQLGGEINQYTVDFNVQPNHVSNASAAGQPAPPIAGGASDRYLRFDLSAVVSLGQ